MSEQNQKQGALFLQLVLTFQTAAWQQMGKIKNPMTDKVEKDLRQAQFSIDILEMIRAKTEGNLTEGEQQFLNKSISELQLNYIDEVNREQRIPEEEKKVEEKTTKEETAEAPKAKKRTGLKDAKKSKSAKSRKKSDKKR